jgi:hypothetical protein
VTAISATSDAVSTNAAESQEYAREVKEMQLCPPRDRQLSPEQQTRRISRRKDTDATSLFNEITAGK